jgi:phosphoribosylformylglycinamidine (FGAM) synthase-like amidotransferase family enzyme
VKFGIVRFPGSCDEVDAQLACARVGEAVILWHGDRDLAGVDAVVVPGGFSYGDYLRVGAIARFAPVMGEVAEFARAGGLVLGICNGFYAPEPELRRLESAGQVLLRYAPGHNPNGSLRDIAGVCNESGNVFGLMPHPEHAVDPLTGSTDGLSIFESIRDQVADRVVA